jgi:Ras-related protein Rab-5C
MSRPLSRLCHLGVFVCVLLKVELEEASTYAADNNILHLETSAKNAKNVKQLFVAIAQKLPKNPPETAREAFPIIPPKDQKRAACC